MVATSSRGGSRLEARTAGREVQAGIGDAPRLPNRNTGGWEAVAGEAQVDEGAIFMVQLRFGSGAIRSLRFRFCGSGSVPRTS